MSRSSAAAVPSEFCCPLTKTIMTEPVMNKYGISYEKGAILSWLNKGNNTCPVTGNPFRPSNLVSNKALSYKIQAFEHNSQKSAEVQEDSEDVSHDDAATDLHEAFVTAIPQRFRCPLTKKVMRHPVITKDGISFERDAILRWMESTRNDFCPISGKSLCARNIIPNIQLEWDIKQWQEKNQTGEIYSINCAVTDGDGRPTSKKDEKKSSIVVADHKTILSKLRNAMHITKMPSIQQIQNEGARSA